MVIGPITRGKGRVVRESEDYYVAVHYLGTYCVVVRLFGEGNDELRLSTHYAELDNKDVHIDSTYQYKFCFGH